MTVRTRFAPSPTGQLHLGNVRIAVFNWLYTRRHGGQFVLRIEDTDLERNVEGAEAGVMEDLHWLGLDWDEGPDIGGSTGPYRQSERAALYTAHADQLRVGGSAYPCFCGDEAGGEERRYPGTCRALEDSDVAKRLSAGEPHVLRLRTPDAGEVRVVDEIRGEVGFPAEDIDDFVLLRSDGRATYNFAVVVDDMLMGITDVIRGSGHLSNTPKQQLLFQAFEAAVPRFAHLPTVLSPDGGKLSKRSGAAAVAELREQGMLPDAVVNYLSLLGWAHPEEKEILTPAEIASVLEMSRVGASDTQFDPEKMRWVAQQHFQRLSEEEYLDRIRPSLLEAGISPEGVPAAAEALRSRLATFGEVSEHLHHFFPSGPTLEEGHARVMEMAQGEALILSLRRHLADLDRWEAVGIKTAFRAAGEELGLKGRDLFVPIRVLLTGEDHGPDLALVVAALGSTETAARLAGA